MQEYKGGLISASGSFFLGPKSVKDEREGGESELERYRTRRVACRVIGRLTGSVQSF